MNFTTHGVVTAAFLLVAAGTSPVMAQSDNGPSVEIETTSVVIGVGGQSGDGLLNLPNLGTNCVYPFKVSGFGAGIQVAVSKISAAGPIRNLTRLEDFPGNYSASEGQATVLAGAGAMSMKNTANNVLIDLTSKTAGLGLGIGASGLTINMLIAPATEPRAYVFEFGFNKNWLSLENKNKLNQLVNAWKCRFVKIDVAGHTDTTGKEANNLNLSELRANAVRDYLVGAGVVPARVNTHVPGEQNLQVPTPNGVRLRSNRVVVVTIQ
ncbi:MAG TPA: OmpA family protein [Stellaceae bacterium]|nr:OmpA family protein [Stellaceae bacterium]